MTIKKPSRNWSGHLTTENIDDVANVLRDMLKGEKYTFASMLLREGLTPKMNVRTSQILKDSNPVHVYRHSSEHVGFVVSDSYGVWGVSTTGKGAYITFQYSKITIRHESAAGNAITWVMALEE